MSTTSNPSGKTIEVTLPPDVASGMTGKNAADIEELVKRILGGQLAPGVDRVVIKGGTTGAAAAPGGLNIFSRSC